MVAPRQAGAEQAEHEERLRAHTQGRSVPAEEPPQSTPQLGAWLRRRRHGARRACADAWYFTSLAIGSGSRYLYCANIWGAMRPSSASAYGSSPMLRDAAEMRWRCSVTRAGGPAQRLRGGARAGALRAGRGRRRRRAA